MKPKILAAIALVVGFCTQAFAVDWPGGQCPIGDGPFNPYPAGTIGGTAGPTSCAFYSGQVTSTFSDTISFTLGNWDEFYGIWTYTSTTGLSVFGRSGVTPCSGRGGCRGLPYAVVIDSAMIDGVPLAPPISGNTWMLGIDFTPGLHVVAATGHTTGVIWQGSKWGMVTNPLFTLEALLAPPPCTDCGD